MDYYGTLEAAATYHAARGNAAWAASTDPLRTAALIRASASLDGQYAGRWPGSKATRAQALQWPRVGATDHCVCEDIPEDEIPVEVEQAAYALALVELAAPGSTAPSLTLGRVAKRQKAGEVEREFFGPSDGVAVTMETLRPVLAVVEDQLRCLLVPRSASQILLRV